MESFWSAFPRDPRLPQHAPMRAADSDREIVRQLLAEAFADGRLRREEYDERLESLLESRTLGDLPGLVDDLVPTHEPAVPERRLSTPAELRDQGVRAWRRDLQEAASTWAVPTLIFLVVWVATGANFFWPLFPILFIGIHPLQTLLRRESIIEEEIKKLQKKERKELEKSSSDQDEHPDSNDPG